jgi:hypothetical protein
MLKKELENRLNRLLDAARRIEPSEELAHYAGRTVEQLRQGGNRLMGLLQAELDTLLTGLTKVATEGKSAREMARELNMPVGDCGRAANLLGDCVEGELDDLESEEEVVSDELQPGS